MSIMSIFILNSTQSQAAVALNDGNAALDPQAITNPLADNVGAGLGIGNLVGLYYLPARLMNDPAYSRWIEMFTPFPVYTCEMELLYTPLILE